MELKVFPLSANSLYAEALSTVMAGPTESWRNYMAELATQYGEG